MEKKMAKILLIKALAEKELERPVSVVEVKEFILKNPRGFEALLAEAERIAA